ncbi:hypothetical protein [Sphingomonas cavernae]|uniref:Uncharacterized protein n=1 Tax=Sphingomonas cavernae TaxID=2320861 RepID=A0A418WP48_9SPHN|nr:hypothetical protein [Sphingomonas cavernae]RJF93016.1 hypothetical protein D3876_01110 [Sphingomonas cavernae]
MRNMIKVGDVLPMPAGYDPEALRYAIARRGLTERTARSASTNQRAKTARLIMAAIADQHRRATDPIEQAAAFLRRRGFVVFNQGQIDSASGTGYVVGRKRFDTSAELLDYARARGWQG